MLSAFHRVRRRMIVATVNKLGYRISEIGHLVECSGERCQGVGVRLRHAGLKLRIWAFEYGKEV